MRVAPAAALLVGVCACRIDLDKNESARRCKVSETVPACLEADSHSDFEWVQENIFAVNCTTTNCHAKTTTGLPPKGQLVLTGDGVMAAYTAVMGTDRAGVVSQVDGSRHLVVPGNAEASYLFFLIRGVSAQLGEPPFDPPPDDVGYMPMSNSTICCQKIDAIARWIEAGALPPAM